MPAWTLLRHLILHEDTEDQCVLTATATAGLRRIFFRARRRRSTVKPGELGSPGARDPEKHQAGQSGWESSAYVYDRGRPIESEI